MLFLLGGMSLWYSHTNMKMYDAKIKLLESYRIFGLKHYAFHDATKYFSYVSKVGMFILSKVLRAKEGELLILETGNQKAFRSLLNTLIKKGFIHSYGEGVIFYDYPAYYLVGITFNIDVRLSGIHSKGWGYVTQDEDKELAYAKALGEALERHATYYLENSTVHSYPKTYEGDASFLYEYIPKFTQEQIRTNKKVVASQEDLKKIRGFKVPSVTGGGKRFLPLSCFYWGQEIPQEGKLLFHRTTNGSGGGVTHEQAFTSALYELIERDHFLLYWFSGVKPKVITNKSIPDDLGVYVAEVEREYQLEVYFLDTRYDIDIKSCVCIVVDPVLNIIAMGGKTHHSSMVTLRAALLEALSVMFVVRHDRAKIKKMIDFVDTVSVKKFTTAIDMIERMNLFCSPEGIAYIKKYFIGKDRVTFDFFSQKEKKFVNEKEERKFLIDEFKKLVATKGEGYHVYEHTASSVWTKEMEYSVVRVFVPALLKLHLKETLATPVSERLFTFAREKGYPLAGEESIKTVPHFFP